MLSSFSNPEYVKNKAKVMGLNPVYESSRKNKKYTIFDGHKWVHFGQLGYQDYTRHKDEKRRLSFQKRNHKWENSPVYSPAWLSWHLLW